MLQIPESVFSRLSRMKIAYCQCTRSGSSGAPTYNIAPSGRSRYGALIVVVLLLGLTGQGCFQGLRVTASSMVDTGNTPLLFEKPELSWKRKLAFQPAALATIGSDLLLVTTYQGELLGFDLESGSRKGRLGRSLDEPVTTQLVTQQGPRVYIASAQDEKLLAYNPTRRLVLWTCKAAGVTGQLSLAGELLLTASLTGEVAAYQAADGRSIWHRQLQGRIYRGTWVFDERVLVLNDQGALYALSVGSAADPSPTEAADRLNAEHPLVWQRKLPVNSSAVVGSGGGLLVIGNSDGRLLLIDPEEGEILFQVQLGAPIYSQPLVTDELVVVATAVGEIIAIQLSDGLPVWRVQDAGLVRLPLLSAGAQTARIVLVPFARGQLLALDLATGQELWRYDLENPIEKAILTPDGIAVATRGDQLYYFCSVKPTAGQPD